MRELPRPGDIFYLSKDKPFQVITIGIHKETCESMVIYQALFGEFKTFVLPLSKFMNEMQQEAPDTDNNMTESERDAGLCITVKDKSNEKINKKSDEKSNDMPDEKSGGKSKDFSGEMTGDMTFDKAFDKGKTDNKVYKIERNEDKVDNILLDFLDANTYAKKLEVITTHIKAVDDRLINNMAASLDCTIEDGPLDHRLQELIYCLKQMSRFEDRRLR